MKTGLENSIMGSKCVKVMLQIDHIQHDKDFE